MRLNQIFTTINVIIFINTILFCQETTEVAKLPKLFIETLPDSASIFFNDSIAPIGTTPWIMKNNPKRIYIKKITLKKYSYMDTTFFTRVGIEQKISIKLKKIFKHITLYSEFDGKDLNAEIYLQNKKIGSTPLKGIFEFGYYEFQLKRDGFIPKYFNISVQDTVSIKKNILLEKQKYYGNIEIKTIPKISNLYINKKNYGKTPVTIANLPIGEYEISINKNKLYNTFKDKIVVYKDSTVKINVNLGKKRIILNYPCGTINKYNKNKISFNWSNILSDSINNINYRLIVSDMYNFQKIIIDTTINRNEFNWVGDLLKWDKTYHWKLVASENKSEIQSGISSFTIKKPKIQLETHGATLNYLYINNKDIILNKKILKGFENILYLETHNALNYKTFGLYPLLIKCDFNPILILNNINNKKFFDGLGFNAKLFVASIYNFIGFKPSFISKFELYSYGIGVFKKDYKICRIFNNLNFNNELFNIELGLAKIYMPYEVNNPNSYKKSTTKIFAPYCYHYKFSFYKNICFQYNIIMSYSYLKSFGTNYYEQVFSIGLISNFNNM